MTRFTDEDFARETGPVWRFLKGIVRRLAVTIADSSTSWQLRGVRSQRGGDEVFQAELFPGIGIFARPPASGSPEAITVGVGGEKSRVIIATRDEATRAKIASQVGVGETAVYNAAGIVLLKADGTIEVRTHAGAAVPLALKSDMTAMRSAFAAATVVANDGGASLKSTFLSAWSGPVGTTKLRGE